MTSVSVNIASIETVLNNIQNKPIHVITLNHIDISYNIFRNIFFPNNNVFSFNLRGAINNLGNLTLLSNNNQVIATTDVSFNIYENIISFYENYVGPRNYWDSCSLGNFQKILSRQKTLFNSNNLCNIKCSITLNDFFNSIEQQGIDLSNVFQNGFRIINNAVPIDQTKKPIAVITSKFTSTTMVESLNCFDNCISCNQSCNQTCNQSCNQSCNQTCNQTCNQLCNQSCNQSNSIYIPDIDILWQFKIDFSGVTQRI